MQAARQLRLLQREPRCWEGDPRVTMIQLNARQGDRSMEVAVRAFAADVGFRRRFAGSEERQFVHHATLSRRREYDEKQRGIAIDDRQRQQDTGSHSFPLQVTCLCHMTRASVSSAAEVISKRRFLRLSFQTSHLLVCP